MLPPVANRFVAGETPAEAIEYARRRSGDGPNAMLNRLGSHHRDLSSVRADADEYVMLVEELARLDGDPAVSVKPTQLGLEIGEPLFRTSLEHICERAAGRDVAVWLDMEEHWTVEPTLEVAVDLAREYGGVGVCIQADLKRSRADLRRLADEPVRVRLVKGGAYDRPDPIAYTDPDRRDRAYRALLSEAFDRLDGGIAVATHDPAMLEHAVELGDRHETAFEIQMLMGVRPTAQRTLADEYEVREFVPYGPRWKRWAFNRARRNLGFAARAVGETLVPTNRAASGIAARR
ncbi:proline dehydrogenase family protein [Natrarchaeobius oligotrophus]|uniref:Proline dehydrogenase n=1 Tax=Natrarchaeobius chitinivorans TaxID=1679083 RepID=A0A3N6PJM3_NATCH|nr:proline dehydrogenase family protein [Natrarchaeobius chitinivorans]RQG98785.1 proline dehydrogenase [Natrarchaeobius chitinivorans]